MKTTRCSVHRHVFGVAVGLALATSAGAQQTYVSATAVNRSVVGWFNNFPGGTLSQDWFQGSSVPAGTSPTAIANINDRRDTNYVSAAGDAYAHGGLTLNTVSPRTSQRIIGLGNGPASDAVARGDYLAFPFTVAAAPNYADGSTPSPIQYYLNDVRVGLSNRWVFTSYDGYQNDNQFGYAVYLYDAAGNPVGGALEVAADASAFRGENLHTIFNVPTGDSAARILQPGANYTLRVYLHKRTAADHGRAGWDDVGLGMSRNTVAELSVQASAVTVTPNGSNNNYSYSFEVYNNGPDAGTALVTDPLPATNGAASASWSCVITGTTTPCTTASGSGPISAVSQALNSGQRVTYTVKWTGTAPTAVDAHAITIARGSTSPQDILAPNNTTSVTIPIATSSVAGTASNVPVPTLSSLGLLLLSCLMPWFAAYRRRT